MLHTTKISDILLVIGVLALLGVPQADSVVAGNDVRIGQGPEAEILPVVMASLPLPPSNFAICDEVSEIPRIECEALVALYQSTNGPGWARQDGWLATNTPCSWFGVICGAGNVQGLDLFANGLSGNLPSELGNLVSLHILYLPFNELTGGIPSELGNLSLLQGLFLSTNQLSGRIPPELGDLTNLQSLQLASNKLSGSIPPELGNLALLTNLFLGDNQLSGSIPPELSALTNLRGLFLYNNQLSGGIPPELSNLALLESLDLSFNHLSGSIPRELSDLANLRGLFLSGNQLRGSIPPRLGNLANLNYLVLSSNQLSGVLPRSLMNLSPEGFGFADTYLCEPPDQAFQRWLASIPFLFRSGLVCSVVYLPLCPL